MDNLEDDDLTPDEYAYIKKVIDKENNRIGFSWNIVFNMESKKWRKVFFFQYKSFRLKLLRIPTRRLW